MINLNFFILKFFSFFLLFLLFVYSFHIFQFILFYLFVIILLQKTTIKILYNNFIKHLLIMAKKSTPFSPLLPLMSLNSVDGSKDFDERNDGLNERTEEGERWSFFFLSLVLFSLIFFNLFIYSFVIFLLNLKLHATTQKVKMII